jgi:hypothetical protein
MFRVIKSESERDAELMFGGCLSIGCLGLALFPWGILVAVGVWIFR